MLTNEVVSALNDLMVKEHASSMLYLSMAAYFDYQGYNGFCHFFKEQSDEERGHAMKLYQYLLMNRAEISIGAIPTPETFWKDISTCINAYYENEKAVTEAYKKFGDRVTELNDMPTIDLATEFLTQQISEEKHAYDLVLKTNDAGKDVLLMIDHEIGEDEINVEFE